MRLNFDRARLCKLEKYNNKVLVGPTLYLLHYKFIGGIERLKTRQRQYGKRLSRINIQKKEGLHYLKKGSEIEQDYNDAIHKSTKII